MKLLRMNGAQYKTYGLFVSGIFHLIFLDLRGLQVTNCRSKTLIRVMFYCIIKNVIWNSHEPTI